MANKYGQMGRNPSKGRDTNAKRKRAKRDIIQADSDLKFSKLLVPVMSEKETPTSKEYLKKVEKALAKKEDANKRLISTYKKGGAVMPNRGGNFKGIF